MSNLPTLPKRARYVGIAFIILGILFLGQSISFMRARHDNVPYLMAGLSIILMLSGLFRIWRAAK
jgi:hypothetical protein